MGNKDSKGGQRHLIEVVDYRWNSKGRQRDTLSLYGDPRDTPLIKTFISLKLVFQSTSNNATEYSYQYISEDSNRY